MVSDHPRRQTLCASYLRALLTGPYRHVWLRMVDRERSGEINFSAVAKVLARTAELDTPDGVDHRGLRDRVRRALSQDRLTTSTLDLFIRGFGIHGPETERLWILLLGGPVVPEPRTPQSLRRSSAAPADH
ncbi:hypothetical protein FB565_004014 [Actinoplanes lutulentus]|uniref:hypothetical protein n=1 Tax=Actinoplanes lutulentus TaxID=1287878 RepID=UPI0011B940D7|nr:hypothetical protein [Actinoplanes lutulentus]MBB2944285.1 hypothetical protein [Actinoplanes lutulentus]